MTTSQKTTYDTHGNELSFRYANGIGYDYTRDEQGNELSFRYTSGAGHDYTRDEQGNVMSFRNTDGIGWDVVAEADGCQLRLRTDGRWSAGLYGPWTTARALEYWGNPKRNNNRAIYFEFAIRMLTDGGVA